MKKILLIFRNGIYSRNAPMRFSTEILFLISGIHYFSGYAIALHRLLNYLLK